MREEKARLLQAEALADSEELARIGETVGEESLAPASEPKPVVAAAASRSLEESNDVGREAAAVVDTLGALSDVGLMDSALGVTSSVQASSVPGMFCK